MAGRGSEAPPAASRLRLPAEVRREIELDCAARRPEEACGLLIGWRVGLSTEVVRASAERNVERVDRTRRYEIAPERVLRVTKRARSEGLDVVGVYHSHPDGSARPSDADRARAWPRLSYLIVGRGPGGRPELRSWQLGPAPSNWHEELVEWTAG